MIVLTTQIENSSSGQITSVYIYIYIYIYTCLGELRILRMWL